MTDLNDAPIVANSGWILTAATAINDNGDIVGSGVLDGQAHGFLLTTGQTLPPPTSEPPIALVSADVTVGRVPQTVNFSSTGSFDPDSAIAYCEWNFGDGSAVSNEENPVHEYTVPRTYTAVLTATDDPGLTATAQVKIGARKSKGRR